MPRRFRGFAVIERPDGSLIWDTFRPVQSDAWVAYQRHNPAVPGYPTQAQLVAVSVMIVPVTRSHGQTDPPGAA